MIIALASLFTLALPARAFDERIVKLGLVLEKYNSPMLGSEQALIGFAESNGLDWRILAAIAGVESSFGKRMPYQCTNPYGWGITGNGNRLCFEDFVAATKAVGEGLGNRYNTDSVLTIARTYNPGNYADWANKVTYFMNKISSQEIPVSRLPITL